MHYTPVRESIPGRAVERRRAGDLFARKTGGSAECGFALSAGTAETGKALFHE